MSTVFQFYYDGDATYEHKLLPTLGILTYTIKQSCDRNWPFMACQVIVYTVGKLTATPLNVIAVTGFIPLFPGSPSPQLNQLVASGGEVVSVSLFPKSYS